VISDIDDRKRNAERVQESERQLRLLVDTVPALIWCGTPAGELSYVNQRLLDFIGARHPQLATWQNLIHPEDLERVVTTWRHSVVTGESYSDTYRFRRADGIFRRVRSSGEPLRAADGKTLSWYGITTDIEDGELLEESLRVAQARLADAVRRSTVGELSASIAHEINQPLTAIVSAAEACLHWLDAAPPNITRARRTACSIVQDGKSAAKVVDRIRSLFTHAVPVKTTIPVEAFLNEVLLLMDDRLRAGHIHPQLTIEPKCPPAWADRVYFQQILINLIQNSVDSFPSTSNRPRLISVTVSKLDTELEAIAIAVRDNGEGIADLDHIFDSFFTTKDHGLGVGLSICRSMVEAHGGRLWATSIPGEGSIFSFTLPIEPGVT
jgi:PAS domain S-box-containing protein